MSVDLVRFQVLVYIFRRHPATDWTVMFPTGSGSRGVSFRARGLTDYVPDSSQDFITLVFPDVEFNQGDGYDATSGRFLAPVAGTYILFASCVTIGELEGAVKLQFASGPPLTEVCTFLFISLHLFFYFFFF